MILSDQTQSVSWRLNDLLKAGKKAKAFAAASWQPSEKEPESQSFSHWQPLVLDTVPEGAVETESLDVETLPDQQEAEIEELPDAAELEQAAAEEQAMVAEAAAEQAKRDAYEEGYQRGIEQGTADSEAKWAQAREAFVELTQSVRTAQDDMTEFYAPLKKLALHLAEQLVRGELTVSSAAIERLTKEALKDVEQQGEGPIVIHLHPLDMEKFSTHLNGELDGLDLRSDHDLSQGSVKVSIDDSAIEDLIEHRLEHLSEKLLGYAPGMRETTNSSTFDSNFANPVMEKVIEIDQAPESLDNIVSEDQEPLNDIASIDEQALDEQAQDNQPIDEKFIDEQSLDNDSEDPDA
jgi:flagellar biosynthesis/type III secretory pathway protein FliH